MVVSYSSILGFKHNPVRLFTRSSGVVAVCICSILYLAWYLPTLSVKTELTNAWSEAPRRLIVFGDSWSDDGKYPIDPPPRTLRPLRSEAQGQVWTEWLCLAACRPFNSGDELRPGRLTMAKDQMQPSRQLRPITSHIRRHGIQRGGGRQQHP